MALLLFLAGLIGAIGIGVGLPFGRRPSAGGGGGEGLNEWITPFIFMNDHVE